MSPEPSSACFSAPTTMFGLETSTNDALVGASPGWGDSRSEVGGMLSSSARRATRDVDSGPACGITARVNRWKPMSWYW